MKTIHLHIGTFKTGTSSIQSFLCGNKDYLAENGFFVPSSQLIGHHELPLSLIKNKTTFRAPWPEFSGGLELWDKVKDEIEKSSCRDVVISSEAFCDLYNEHCRGNSEEIRMFIAEWFSDFNVKVYCYLRPLPTYSKSMYGENIKNSPLRISFLERLNNNIAEKSIHLYPSTYLGFFSEVFGRENIKLRCYDRRALYGNDVVLDFFQWIGLDVDVKKNKIEDKNLSIPENIWFLKRAFNESLFQDFSYNVSLSNSLISLNDYLQKSKSSDFDFALKEMSCEHKIISKDYNLNLGEIPSDTFDFSTKDEDIINMFLISLVSKVLKQNDEIARKLEEIDSFLGVNK